MTNKPGRPCAAHGKSKLIFVPLGCLAQVILIINQFKQQFKAKDAK